MAAKPSDRLLRAAGNLAYKRIFPAPQGLVRDEDLPDGAQALIGYDGAWRDPHMTAETPT
jgi:hypothetical protein